MSKTSVEITNFPYLPTTEGNKLVCTESNWKSKKGLDMDDDYYVELTQDDTFVAKYHVFSHMSIYPPFEVNDGWEKFTQNDVLIASGKKS